MSGVATAVVGSSVYSSHQADKAADKQAAAAQSAQDLEYQMWMAGRRDLRPYKHVAVGKGGKGGALNELASYGRSRVDPRQYTRGWRNVPEFDPNIDVTQDPGYAFRLGEMERAVNRNMAAAGGVTSGNRLEEIMSRAGDMASQEYGQAYNRALTEYGADVERSNMLYGRGVDAYNRMYGREQDYLNNLRGLSNVGQQATSQGIGVNQAYSSGAGAAMMNAGAARAAGDMARANAVSGAVGDYMMYNTLYNSPGGRTPMPDVSNLPTYGSGMDTSGWYKP